MKKEYELVLFGNRVRHLIDIFGLEKDTQLDCIYMNRKHNYIQTTKLKNMVDFKKHRLTKGDVKLIHTLYQITDNLETSLFHLFKD